MLPGNGFANCAAKVVNLSEIDAVIGVFSYFCNLSNVLKPRRKEQEYEENSVGIGFLEPSDDGLRAAARQGGGFACGR